uniref:Uncharacterized protein n=1 Tax=Bionectria ochroleuca TaxID=29856 RepID=A0A8H7KF90_BIOOC
MTTKKQHLPLPPCDCNTTLANASIYQLRSLNHDGDRRRALHAVEPIPTVVLHQSRSPGPTSEDKLLGEAADRASPHREPSPEFLTAEEEIRLVRFHTIELIQAAQFCELPTEIRSTAAVFFRRFYVTNSVMTYPDRAAEDIPLLWVQGGGILHPPEQAVGEAVGHDQRADPGRGVPTVPGRALRLRRASPAEGAGRGDPGAAAAAPQRAVPDQQGARAGEGGAQVQRAADGCLLPLHPEPDHDGGATDGRQDLGGRSRACATFGRRGWCGWGDAQENHGCHCQLPCHARGGATGENV